METINAKKLSRDELRLEIEGLLQQLIAEVVAGLFSRRPPAPPNVLAERIVRLAEQAFGRPL